MQGKGFQKVQESQNYTQQNVEATLIVDLYNTSSQSLVWRGIAQNTLSNNDNKN
jgi:hypothetical protein